MNSNYKHYFEILVKSEFIFLIPLAIKLFWFNIFHTSYTLQDLQYFSPLSVFSFFDPKEIDTWLVYPMQLFNVFELLYWLILAYLLKDVLGKGFKDSLGFVATTYGVGLFIWVVLVMFLIVNIS